MGKKREMRKSPAKNDVPDTPADHSGLASPSDWILRWHHEFGSGTSVLDLACGSGRHGRLFLDNGATVTFVDIDVSGLSDMAENRQAEILQADLENKPWPLEDRRFDAIVITNYLHRPLFPQIIAAVAPGGWLFYETFAVGNERYGKPTNPDYLLKHDELKHTVEHELDVIGYAHSLRILPKRAVMQHIAAQRPVSNA